MKIQVSVEKIRPKYVTPHFIILLAAGFASNILNLHYWHSAKTLSTIRNGER